MASLSRRSLIAALVCGLAPRAATQVVSRDNTVPEPRCEGRPADTTLAAPCAVVARYLAAEASGRIWPRMENLGEFVEPDSSGLGNSALVAVETMVCPGRMSVDTVLVAVWYGEVGRVSYSEGPGESWWFDQGPQWNRVVYRVVSAGGRWRMLFGAYSLDPHLTAGAAIRAFEGNKGRVRSELAVASAALRRLPRPHCDR